MPKKKLTARKQPRQARSVATVEAVLQAATYILSKQGWATFTTNAVAEKAGVNIASLYQYFPNKEAIVAELQRRHVEEIERHWPEPPEGAPLPELLGVMLEAMVAEHRVNPALHRVFAEELPRAQRLGTVASDAGRRWRERMLEQMKVPDAELATFITRVALHAVIHEAACERPEVLRNPQLVSELVRLLGGYLSGGGPSGLSGRSPSSRSPSAPSRAPSGRGPRPS